MYIGCMYTDEHDVGRRMYGGDVYLYCSPDYSLACFSRRLVTIVQPSARTVDGRRIPN